MKTILKIACKSLLFNRRRTLFTLFCVILSLSMIAIAFGLLDSVLTYADFDGDDETERAVKNFCIAFVVATCFMSCFAIYTAFSVSISERAKDIGFLTSVGMSPPQRAMLVLFEAGLYGLVGIPCGMALGFGIASVFCRVVLDTAFLGETMSQWFVLSGRSILLSALLGVFTVLSASFVPVLKMKKLSVTETIKDNNQINISLKQTLLSRMTEKFFGRIGLLAGQNYDNNKVKYRSISFALSGGKIFFITIYSFFQYPFWYEADRGWGAESVDAIWHYLIYPSRILAAFFVFVFLFCSLGSIRQNMEQRQKEFAMYKSMGMQNSELHKMMNIECAFLAWYSMLFGLMGALAGNYIICTFFRILGVDDLRFHFPIGVYAVFCVLDIVVCLSFALYSRHKISKVNIIETIRNR